MEPRKSTSSNRSELERSKTYIYMGCPSLRAKLEESDNSLQDEFSIYLQHSLPDSDLVMLNMRLYRVFGKLFFYLTVVSGSCCVYCFCLYFEKIFCNVTLSRCKIISSASIGSLILVDAIFYFRSCDLAFFICLISSTFITASI